MLYTVYVTVLLLLQLMCVCNNSTTRTKSKAAVVSPDSHDIDALSSQSNCMYYLVRHWHL